METVLLEIKRRALELEQLMTSPVSSEPSIIITIGSFRWSGSRSSFAELSEVSENGGGSGYVDAVNCCDWARRELL
jgi:hypothetical protein